MAHGTTQRRNIAPPPPPQPKTSMDPTPKKKPNSYSSNTSKQPQPTSQDPTFAPSSTIKNISNQFAKLYVNHKSVASLKGSNGISRSHHHPPPVDTNSKAKEGLPSSAVLDSSCITLTKSNSQHGRNVGNVEKDSSSRTKAKEKDKNAPKKAPPPHGVDVEKALARQNWKDCKEKVLYEEKDLKKSTIDEQFLKKRSTCAEMGRPSSSMLVQKRGRRKSFSCSKTELADFFSCSGVKVVAVDMPPFMQIHAVDCARKAHDSLEKFTSKSLALTLKKEFDGVYGPAWHCIVGTSFGSFVTHSVGGFMYFSMDKLYILLFKTTVRKAD